VHKGLIALFLGGFSIGMAEFLVIGMLPEMSAALDISIPQAGHLISVYALGVVIGAPLLVFLAGNAPPVRILRGLMAAFAVFNLLAAVAPTYELLIAARLFSGLPHGAFFGIGAVVAGQLAAPGRAASAVAVMFSGLTVANVLGVPLGTYIGHAVNWRLAYGLVALSAVAAALAISTWLARYPLALRTPDLARSVSSFERGAFWVIVGMSTIGSAGIYAWISYIAPMMTSVTGLAPGRIPFVMALAGIGMAVGNFLGGWLADRYSPARTTSGLLLAMALAALVVGLTARHETVALAMAFVGGVVAFSTVAPMQVLVILMARGSKILASALVQSTANLGNALGAYLGGVPIALGYGAAAPQYVGALLAAAGFGLSVLLIRRYVRPAEAPLPPEPAPQTA